MPLLNTSLPNLAQGVSQQPDNLRFPGQCDEQINAWSTVVEGLVKRPNSRFLYDTALGANVNSNLFTHFVDRDNENKYVVTYDSTNGLKVLDLLASSASVASISISVVTSLANNYLTGLDPINNLRALTIADSTFIVNTSKTVASETSLVEPLEKEALIFVKLGDYGKNYSIYVNDALVPYDSAAFQGHTSDHAPEAAYISTYRSGESVAKMADTEHIAADLVSLLNLRFPSSGTNYADTITIDDGGSGYGLQFLTGAYADQYRRDYEDYFVTIEIVQAGAGTAVALATLDANGTITGASIIKSGSNFDPTAAYTFEIYEYATYTRVSVQQGQVHDFEYDRLYYLGQVVDPAVTSGWTVGVVSAPSVTVERQGSVIKLTQSLAGKDFSVRTTDGLSNQGLGTIYKEVNSITDLPLQCYNTFRVKIIGDDELAQDDYYVRFKTKDGESFGEGSWVETVGWFRDGSAIGQAVNIDQNLNQSTMPVRLIPNQGVGKITGFTLDVVEWQGRIAGDDQSNPFPTFNNKKINDIFFFKNRLGFLTDGSVIFSEADEYYNFFRTTTQTLLDSAPIDVGISHTKISILKYAQAFQEKLMLFSSKTQFVLRGGDLLTPKTVNISPVTDYDVSDSIRPLALNNYIYFNFKRNNFEGVLEYFVDRSTEVYQAQEITVQIPKYIKSNIVKMEGSSSENMIAVLTDTEPTKLFIYKYFWQGNEKVQSAWCSFTFSRNVRSFYFIESTLYIITTDSTGTYLEEIPMEVGLQDGSKTYALLLDSRLDQSELTIAYDAATKLTTISGFPYDPSDVDLYTENGVKLAFTRTTSTEGTVLYDLTGLPFYAGIPYDMLYRFSKQTLKQPTERQGRSASAYSFQTIRSGSVEYTDTGHFTVEVTPTNRDTYSYVFNPDILGANLILNNFTPQDGHFRFPIQAQPSEVTIEVKSSSALPVKLVSAEFESTLISRSRRYGG